MSAIALLALAACSPRTTAGEQVPTAGDDQADDRVASSTVATIRIGPLTPTDEHRIPPAEAAAVVALGRSGAPVPSSGHGGGHDHTAHAVELPLSTEDAGTFVDQWQVATTSTARFDTVDEIRALGYVRASAPSPGVGTHWVHWSQIAAPFDPRRPSMVLYDETADPAVLVGYSYWLQSADEPTGFAGGNDHWHQHRGLCVVNGWVDREEATGPEACAGTYLAGGDLWMLHAWVVEDGWANRLGRFASFHPALCPSRFDAPDVARCPE